MSKYLQWFKSYQYFTIYRPLCPYNSNHLIYFFPFPYFCEAQGHSPFAYPLKPSLPFINNPLLGKMFILEVICVTALTTIHEFS